METARNMMKGDASIKSFEGLRGIAALAVAIYHFNGFLRPNTIVDSFYLLVDLFFILSGFVIYRAYDNQLSSWPKLAKFVVRRIGRLYPLHIFSACFFVGVTCGSRVLKTIVAHIGLGAVLSAPGADVVTFPGLPEIMTNLLLLQGIGPLAKYEINGPSWSISTEFYSYLILALGVYLLAARARLLAFAIIALSGLALSVYGSLYVDHCTQAGHCLDSHLAYAFPRCVGSFFLGVFAERLATLIERVPERCVSVTQVAASGMAIIVMWQSINMPGLAFAAMPLFFVVVLTLSGDRGPLARMLQMPVCQSLGRISYSVYLIHAPLVFVGHFTLKPISIVVKICILLGYIAIVLLISTQTYRFIEAPARDATRRWSARRFNNLPTRTEADSDSLQQATKP
ncbi:acyltransferase family protein [Burkholderia diffusa]|nr:acyltransferase [Burkholderia diffusa]